MVNTDDFIKRLEFLMDNYSLNASAFADKIGVQRSSISHLLSGRNKPSLDFVLKIQEFFPEVNLYWILKGTEKFLKSEQKVSPVIDSKLVAAPTLFEVQTSLTGEITNDEKSKNLDSKNEPSNNIEHKNVVASGATIFKIVIFYSDGTFKDFIQS